MPEQVLHKYNLLFPHQIPNELTLELVCYRLNHPPEKGGLGPAGHFRNVVNMLWGHDKGRFKFDWHPWAETMCSVTHRHPLTGQTRPHCAFSGCSSSGKTMYSAVYALVNWLCAPSDTTVLVTSTDLPAARKRIWGAIVNLWLASPPLPGHLVDSMGKIVSLSAEGQKMTDISGISLIAADRKKEKEAVEKIIGVHNRRVIFIADELPELSPAILEACFGNLVSNPFFQFIAMGNFKSRYDPFGDFIQPKDGWDSLDIDTEHWETHRGYCVRFDGMKSPNVISGRDEYPKIYSTKTLAVHRDPLKGFGENSAMFWRMCRSFEAPIGLDNVIYSEADLLSGKAYDVTPIWREPPIRISSLDPSFTSGGDRAVQIIGLYGQTIEGLWTIHTERIMVLHDNAKVRAPRDYQIARQFRDNCIANGIAPINAALDTTGAGSVLHSILSEEWSPEVMGVNFSGAPSETFLRVNDPTMAKAQYDRKVSELWAVGREFMRYGQIKGITQDLARELKARQFETLKGPEGLKICVETKEKMKKRLGFSPDIADSWAVLVALCRERLGALAGGADSGLRALNKSWQKELDIAQDLYENAKYEEPDYASMM